MGKIQVEEQDSSAVDKSLVEEVHSPAAAVVYVLQHDKDTKHAYFHLFYRRCNAMHLHFHCRWHNKYLFTYIRVPSLHCYVLIKSQLPFLLRDAMQARVAYVRQKIKRQKSKGRKSNGRKIKRQEKQKAENL